MVYNLQYQANCCYSIMVIDRLVATSDCPLNGMHHQPAECCINQLLSRFCLAQVLVASPHCLILVVKEELPALEIAFALVEPHHHRDVTLLQVVLHIFSSDQLCPCKNSMLCWWNGVFSYIMYLSFSRRVQTNDTLSYIQNLR